MSEILSEFRKLGKLDLCLRLTLVLLLLYPGDSLRVRVPMTILALLALVFPHLQRQARYWCVVAISFVLANLGDWYQLDNHKYLLAYWCIAVFCSLQTHDPAAALKINSRLLIGLCFALAVLWKISVSDYLDGTFFEYSLLTDKRFHGVAAALGGITDPMKNVNSAALTALTNYDSRLDMVQLRATQSIHSLAQFMTRWTVVIETLIAAGFLLPRRAALARCRDYFLITFLITTYALAPVVGFGWLLAIMGLAQTDEQAEPVQLLYVAALICLQIYRLPWQSML
jgi:hypothetical protein